MHSIVIRVAAVAAMVCGMVRSCTPVLPGNRQASTEIITARPDVSTPTPFVWATEPAAYITEDPPELFTPGPMETVPSYRQLNAERFTRPGRELPESVLATRPIVPRPETVIDAAANGYRNPLYGNYAAYGDCVYSLKKTAEGFDLIARSGAERWPVARITENYQRGRLFASRGKLIVSFDEKINFIYNLGSEGLLPAPVGRVVWADIGSAAYCVQDEGGGIKHIDGTTETVIVEDGEYTILGYDAQGIYFYKSEELNCDLYSVGVAPDAQAQKIAEIPPLPMSSGQAATLSRISRLIPCGDWLTLHVQTSAAVGQSILDQNNALVFMKREGSARHEPLAAQGILQWHERYAYMDGWLYFSQDPLYRLRPEAGEAQILGDGRYMLGCAAGKVFYDNTPKFNDADSKPAAECKIWHALGDMTDPVEMFSGDWLPSFAAEGETERIQFDLICSNGFVAVFTAYASVPGVEGKSFGAEFAVDLTTGEVVYLDLFDGAAG